MFVLIDDGCTFSRLMLGREELLLAVPQQVEQVEQVEQLRRVERKKVLAELTLS